ncbi:sodium-dependent noradrenaline transporter-like [Chrysoperla carnea]|uniref:sodium-dependent noradrenaline transporter-like n=1 Tax=Chrysoperla carnea TaxID=189513 RepID=UPI001D08244B|nr:sodium-dependent noradrenaline transporter-like [Chrysoperla carnea]
MKVHQSAAAIDSNRRVSSTSSSAGDIIESSSSTTATTTTTIPQQPVMISGGTIISPGIGGDSTGPPHHQQQQQPPPPPQQTNRLASMVVRNGRGSYENVIATPEYIKENMMIITSTSSTTTSQTDSPGITTYSKHRMASVNSGSTSTGLDDGYGSSSSTPHAIPGRTQNNKSSPPPISNLVLTYCSQPSSNQIQKKNLQVQIADSTTGDLVICTTTTSSSKASIDSNQLYNQSSVETLEDGVIQSNYESHCTTTGDSKKQMKSTTKSHDNINDNRETWGTNADFLLSIIGFAVDLANVWRFPYLCYKNGGGAFLIPYTLMLVFGAVPLFYMELILGQFNRQGPISVWRICPLFKGVGFCAVLVAFYVSFYYNVIIGWALYFLVSSTQYDLPWIHCNNSWNTQQCWDSNVMNKSTHEIAGVPELASHVNKYTPASEFFHRAVLEMQWSDGLHEMGYPKWQLVLCVFFVYCMLYLSLFKGVKSSGKVVWATATMPYVVLSILLVRGLMLPGAMSGIKYYLQPELSRLSDTQVWVDAAVQIFYSVGAGFGVHLSYASYNTFHNNCFRDCIVTTIVNCFTSFFSGFVIFTYLGFMSYKQGVHISTVATEGPGLVFQVYPEAVATLPGSNFWAMLFFFMLIMLGLDSAMGGMECVITGLMDEFHDFFHNRKYAREIFTASVAFVSFCVALINVTPGGIYMFHLFDTYSAGISLLCSALFEAIAVSWFYGLEKFSQDVHLMIGSKPGLYWRICWKFISPTFIIGVVMFGLIYHEKLQYNEYKYPDWAEWVGWCLALSSILMIPIVMIIQLVKTPGTLKERFAFNITPVEEHEQLRETKYCSRFKCRHWLYV